MGKNWKELLLRLLEKAWDGFWNKYKLLVIQTTMHTTIFVEFLVFISADSYSWRRYLQHFAPSSFFLLVDLEQYFLVLDNFTNLFLVLEFDYCSFYFSCFLLLPHHIHLWFRSHIINFIAYSIWMWMPNYFLTPSFL